MIGVRGWGPGKERGGGDTNVYNGPLRMLKTKWKGTGIPIIIFIIVQVHETLLSGIRGRNHK
jgi:hypothetical protein